jgi:LPXTG-motif cell wall-anchored protein
LLTATAAGTLLCALWFVPSANATGDGSAREASSVTPASQVTTQARAASTTTDSSGAETRLADTGSFDTTPYVIGGTLFLGVGAGFVVYSVRRERLGF